MNIIPLKINYHIQIFLEFIHSSISHFINANLLGDNCFLLGNSPFLIKRLIVETEIPINFETSLMVKKGRSCVFMWW